MEEFDEEDGGVLAGNLVGVRDGRSYEGDEARKELGGGQVPHASLV